MYSINPVLKNVNILWLKIKPTRQKKKKQQIMFPTLSLFKNM